MIVISRNIVLSEVEELSADNPVILWDSLVTTTNVDSTTEDADFPIANVANPATHLRWIGGANAGDEYITITTGMLEPIDGLGVARHNFGSENIVVSVEGAASVDASQKILLDFQGADASTTITDTNAGGSAHAWTAAGNAQLDTAQFKFFGSSLLVDGTGDWVTTPDHADFTLASSNFKVGGWVRPAVNGTAMSWIGQGNSTTTAATTSFVMQRVAAGNAMQAIVSNGSSFTTLTGTTPIVSGAWYYVALERFGNVLTLTVNGIIEATAAFTGAVNDSANAFRVGAGGENTVNIWNGWIGQIGLWSEAKQGGAAFTPPTQYYDQWDWVEIIEERQPADDSPLLFRFELDIYQAVRLRMQHGDDVPTAAVVYLGPLLVLERSIKIDVPHTPFPMGILSKEVNGKSESGNFLGRIEINRFNQSEANFAHFTPTFYRASVQPFVRARVSFFFAWNPTEYPTEVGYAWLLEDPMPEVDTVTRRVAIGLKMQGVV